MLQLLALVHFSAAAERIFSLLNSIKVKNRSKLETNTVNALLHSKSLLKDINSTKYTPSPELCKKLREEHWYKKENHIDEVTS